MGSQKARILLVEDHADTRVMTEKILRMRGYQVASAGSKAEALKRCDEQVFDVLLGDIELLDGSGLELMRELAAKCKIKGIAYAGHGFDTDIQRSRSAGYSAHLTKPAELKLLFEIIDRVMDASDAGFLYSSSNGKAISVLAES